VKLNQLKIASKTIWAGTFWNQIVFFISKDENLTKSHIRYLEGRLLQQANAAGRAILMNSQSSGAKLPESDREDMEVFLEKMQQLLPALGIEVLVPTHAASKSTAEKQLLTCTIKKHRGYRLSNSKWNCCIKRIASSIG
jgi:hypothetical protein